MMKNLKSLLILAAMVPVMAFAQVHKSVNHRQVEQHRRIVAGVHHGSLTKLEAARLRAREAAIRAREHNDRKGHRGHLTIAERRRIERAQSRISHKIYQQKHDRQHRP